MTESPSDVLRNASPGQTFTITTNTGRLFHAEPTAVGAKFATILAAKTREGTRTKRLISLRDVAGVTREVEAPTEAPSAPEDAPRAPEPVPAVETVGQYARRLTVEPEPVPAMPTPGGETFDIVLDGHRLNRQQSCVYAIMADGQWRTLREIEDATGFPQASVSARLRDFRKPPVNRTVERERTTAGTWRYRLIVEEAGR